MLDVIYILIEITYQTPTHHYDLAQHVRNTFDLQHLRHPDPDTQQDWSTSNWVGLVV